MKHPTGMKETEKVTYKQLKSYMITFRNFDKHFFFKYQSYGISKSELLSFPKEAKHILFIETKDDREEKHYYLARVEQFRDGRTWNHILEGNVPDPQSHVSLRDMKLYKDIVDVPEPKEVLE